MIMCVILLNLQGMQLAKFYFNSGYRACQYLKLFKYFQSKGLKWLGSLILVKCKNSTGVEFSPDCVIGEGLKIAHGQDIVIGGCSVIGSNVTIYNGVTIGVSGKLFINDHGKLMQSKDYPKIGNNCIIYTGAKILGPISIGNNSIIGANAVIISDIPENSIVAGIPGKVVNKQPFNLGDF